MKRAEQVVKERMFENKKKEVMRSIYKRMKAESLKENTIEFCETIIQEKIEKRMIKEGKNGIAVLLSLDFENNDPMCGFGNRSYDKDLFGIATTYKLIEGRWGKELYKIKEISLNHLVDYLKEHGYRVGIQRVRNSYVWSEPWSYKVSIWA